MEDFLRDMRPFPVKGPPHDELDTETQVLEVLEQFSDAVCTGDLDQIVSYYAEDVTGFDMMPPLRIQGMQQYRKVWKEYFTDYFRFPVSFTFGRQKILAMGDAACSYGLAHVTGTTKDGEIVDNWIRNTTCLLKQNGKWKIIHDHNSVPIGNDGNALMDLKP